MDDDRHDPNDEPHGDAPREPRRSSRKGELHANRAREMLRQGRLADAERELRAAVASDPTRGDWMLNLGWTLEAGQRLDEALQQYRQSAALLPTARDPRLAEGLLLAKMERREEAVQALEAALRLDPRCETAAAMLIRTLAQLGRHEDAETAYYMAIHAIARPATAHLEIARSLFARGDRRAEQCYRRAITEGPTLVGIRVELARLLLLANRTAETAVLLAEELRRGNVPPPVLLEMARIHLASGRPAEAMQALELLARVEPSNPRLHLLLARAMRRRGDLVRAARHLEIASKLAGNLRGDDAPADRKDSVRDDTASGVSDASEPGVVDLADSATRRRKGSSPLAGEPGEFARQIPRELPRELRSLATEAALVGLARGHVADARRLLAGGPEGPGGPLDSIDHVEYVEALLAVGLVEPAKTAFHQRYGTNFRTRQPEMLDHYRLGGRIALESGDLREGRACARRILRLDPKHANPASIVAFHNLALVALERGRFRAAWAWIARGRAVDPSDAGLRKLRTLWWWRRLLTPFARR